MRDTKIESGVWQSKYVLPYEEDLQYIYRSLSRDNVYNILIGAYRSAKTTTNITAFCMNLELSNERLHFAIATTESNAKTILFDGDGLGIKYFPDWQRRIEYVNGKAIQMPQRIFEGKYKQRDALILYPLPHENKPVKYIVAFGGDKENSYKAFRGQSVGSIISTEANLLHPNTITEYMGRIGASKRMKVFEDGNPGNPKQWYKVHRLDYLMRDRAKETNYGHRTLNDNPVLDSKQREVLSGAFHKDSPQYKNLILGEWVVAEGLIYRLTDKNMINGYNINDYAGYRISADTGVNSSATSFVLQAITRDRQYLDTIEMYYHRNKDEKNEKNIKLPIDYARDFAMFIKDSIELMGKPPIEVLADNDLTFIREFNRIKYEYGLGAIFVNHKFKKDKIEDRINQGTNLFHLGRKRINKEKCAKLIEAYEIAQYDSKEELKGNYIRYDSPINDTMIDPIDADEYSQSRFSEELGRFRG